MEKKKGNRVLVTGGAGFIGSHLCEALVGTGRDVVAIDGFDAYYPRAWKELNLRDVSQLAAHLGRRFEFIEGDLNRPGTLDAVQGDVHSVFHLAAKAGVRPSLLDPLGYIEANVTATTRVLEWSRKRHIPNFIFASSSSVYGNATRAPFTENQIEDAPLSPYAATKRSGELFCATYSQLYGIKTAALRFFTVYGRRQRPDLAIRQFAEKLLRNETITLFGNGSTARDYTHVTDVVNGVLAAEGFLNASAPGTREIFNLGGNRAFTLSEMLAVIEAQVGRKARVEHKAVPMGDVERTWADLEKSKAMLGYWPQVDFEVGVGDMVTWLRSVLDVQRWKRESLRLVSEDSRRQSL